MKCLILKFRNAGIFYDPLKKSKDNVFYMYGMSMIKRGKYPHMDIPVGNLSKRHISNVLHVLMGERPAPSIRASLIKPIPAIQKLAEKSRVKVDSVITRNNNGQDQYFTETKSIRKSISNAWPTAVHDIYLNGERNDLIGCLLTWEFIKSYLRDTPELYNELVDLVKQKLGGKYLNERFEKVLGLLSKLSIEPFIEKCKKMSKTPLAHVLSGTTYAARFFARNDYQCRLTVPKGVEKISRIDGTIYVPMGDNDLERIRNGPGSATILEGGVVFIEGVEDFSDNLVFDTIEPVV